MTRSFPRIISICALLAALTPREAAADTLPATTCPETSTGSGERICALFARPGSVTLPGAGAVPIWGYASTAADPAASPGPALVVNQGDRVTLRLTNGLGVATSIRVSGQVGPPDQAGVAPGATRDITFLASAPGTYLYEAGSTPGTQYQSAMGLHGAVVVRPTPAPATPRAFADLASEYDDEALVILSDLDPELNGAANPAAFDLRAFAPQFRLLNGHPYPDTAAIPTAPGRRVLLRYVNAGLEAHAMSLLGVSQTSLAVDGGRTPAPYPIVSQPLGAGQTADAVATISLGTVAGTRFALYEGALALHNGSAPGWGGMLTFLVAGVGTPGPGSGPVTTAVAVAPSPTTGAAGVTITASVTAAGSTVAGAEAFADAPGAPGSGVPLLATDGAFGGANEGVTLSIPAGPLAGIATGAHPIYVRGRDAGGAWGPVSSAVLLLDHTGPAVAAITAAPGPTNGTVAVLVSARGDDRASGGATVTAAEYFVDPAGTPAPGTGSAMAAGLLGDVTGFTATIAAPTVAGLASGAHTIRIRARDGLGNWGPLGAGTLVLDRTGPVMSFLSVSPFVTDGRQGVSSGNASLRVTGTVTDATSRVVAAEGFIDAAGAPGTGFQLLPVDGIADETAEIFFADVPLSTIVQLAAGSHAFVLRGRDEAGNWGATAPAPFTFTPPPALVADGFESGTLSEWSGGAAGTGSGIAVTTDAQLGGGGKYGLALTVGKVPRFVTDERPTDETSYRARFWFDPNSTGSANVWTLFAGVNGKQTPFQVQYRRLSGGKFQLRAQLLTRRGMVSTPFVAIADAPHAIELAWNAGSGPGPRLQLWVDGALAGTLSGQDTRAQRIESVRLGRVDGVGGNAAGTLYLDGFVSTRGEAIPP